MTRFGSTTARTDDVMSVRFMRTCAEIDEGCTVGCGTMNRNVEIKARVSDREELIRRERAHSRTTCK